MKFINFSVVEILPSLLDRNKTQTIRPAWKTNFDFFKEVIKKEKIKGWKLRKTEGKEGLVLFKSKEVLLGKDCSLDIVLHEIAHILTPGKHHYTVEFNEQFERLKNKYSYEKPPRFKVGEKVQIMWKQRNKCKLFCPRPNRDGTLCGMGIDVGCMIHGILPYDEPFPKKLGEVEITEVFKIEMSKGKLIKYHIQDMSIKHKHFGHPTFNQAGEEELAKLDGFKSIEDMFKWFDKQYDLSTPKQFWVYRWRWLNDHGDEK